MASSSAKLVVAIDFGTTYSGYAYSFKSDPMAIKTNKSWSKSLVSMKTPTVILVNKDLKFDCFGYEAEEKYSQLLEDNEADDWALFRRFKMVLYKTPELSKQLEITDLSGKVKMSAITAFSMSIRYLKNHALSSLNVRQARSVQESDVRFVITVPAIWDDRARLFMREAAAEAGIPTEQFSLALESEAASIWCQSIPFILSSDGTRRYCRYHNSSKAEGWTAERASQSKWRQLGRHTSGQSFYSNSKRRSWSRDDEEVRNRMFM